MKQTEEDYLSQFEGDFSECPICKNKIGINIKPDDKRKFNKYQLVELRQEGESVKLKRVNFCSKKCLIEWLKKS